MSMEPADETKLEAFRQHWEQIRHIEGQRLTFTNFYALIVVGVLTFISQSGKGDHCMLFIVLAVVSLLGIILCVRLNQGTEGHRNRALLLARELTGEKQQSTREKYIPYWNLRPWYCQFGSLRMLFTILYGFGLVFFALLAFGVIRIV
jgi:hypothetical protein